MSTNTTSTVWPGTPLEADTRPHGIRASAYHGRSGPVFLSSGTNHSRSSSTAPVFCSACGKLAIGEKRLRHGHFNAVERAFDGELKGDEFVARAGECYGGPGAVPDRVGRAEVWI